MATAVTTVMMTARRPSSVLKRSARAASVDLRSRPQISISQLAVRSV